MHFDIFRFFVTSRSSLQVAMRVIDQGAAQNEPVMPSCVSSTANVKKLEQSRPASSIPIVKIENLTFRFDFIFATSKLQSESEQRGEI